MDLDLNQLKQILKKATDVSDKLEVLDEIAAHYYDAEDYATASHYYAQAEELAPPGNLCAYYTGQKGICHYLEHRDREAGEALLAARDMFCPEEENFSREIYGLVHYFLGSLYEYNSDNESSLESRLKALECLDDLDREAQWMLLAGISRNYEEKGDYELAVRYNTQAISLISNDDPEVAYIFESLGFNHYEMGEYKKALHYFSRVLEAAPDFERKDDIYFNIGLCNQRLLNYRMALDSYLKLLDIRKLKRAEVATLAWIYIEIAHCYYQLKQHDESLEYVQKALQESIANEEERAEIHSYLTNNYYALGRFEEAVEAGEKTLRMSEKFHNLELMLPNLALSYYQLGLKEKFHYYREWCNRSFPDLNWTRQLNKLKI